MHERHWLKIYTFMEILLFFLYFLYYLFIFYFFIYFRAAPSLSLLAFIPS